MRIKKDTFAYQSLPLYFYMIRAYSKFKVTGRCLNFPLKLQIQTQSHCNGRCLICPYPIVSKQLEQGNMAWDLYCKIIDEVTSAPFPALLVYELHNEPLIDKRIFDFVGHFKSKNPGKKAIIITNGELLDKFEIQEIRASNLDSMVVSLNAISKEMFEAINCSLDYDRVIRNVYSFLNNNDVKTQFGLSFVYTELNKWEIYQAVQHWHQLGISTRTIQLSNRAGALANFDSLKPKQGYRHQTWVSRLRNSLMSPVKQGLGCSLPFYQMCVLFNGDVIICCHDWNRATVVGNVTNSSLMEIWNSEKLNRVRQLMLNKEYREIESCKSCSYAI